MSIRDRIKRALRSFWKHEQVRKFRAYPHLERVETLDKPQIILGKTLTWTEKRDGSNLCFWLDDNGNKVHISSRNQAEADNDLTRRAQKTPSYPRICSFLREQKGRYYLYAELVIAGYGPTKIEGKHDQDELIAFDLWDEQDGNFTSYVQLYQHCYHYGIPVVERWAMTQHRTMDDFYVMRKEILDLAKDKKREGTVIKFVDPSPNAVPRHVYFKEKLDIPPHPKIVSKDEGLPQLPILPDSEVRGELQKMWADYGLEKMRDVRFAMPELARRVARAQVENLCRAPSLPLFRYYTDFLQEKS